VNSEENRLRQQNLELKDDITAFYNALCQIEKEIKAVKRWYKKTIAKHIEVDDGRNDK